jgi:phosphatidylglycerophosphate synthase
MSLHRAAKVPDWEKVPESERNLFQRIAAKTKGVVTPGNVVSATGAALVTVGLADIAKNRKTRGTILLIGGRLLDLGDGTVAELTGTKSPIGEGVDAVIDKAEIAIGLPLLVAKGMVPLERAIDLGVQNATSATINAIAKAKGIEIHPSRSGKDWTMGCWSTVGSYCIEGSAKEEGIDVLATTAHVTGDILFHATSGLGWTTNAGYLEQSKA